MLLLNPPSPPEAVANREGTASFGGLSTGFAYPPHTLATIAAVCRQEGREVAVVDAVGERLDIEACLARVAAAQPDIVAVYCSWGTLDTDRANVAALRAAFPDLPLVAIGASVRFAAEELLVAGASHVLLGDPELTVARLQTPLPPPGLLRVRDFLPDQHNHAGLLRKPEALPRPAWDAVPWASYGFLSMFGARGCDDGCKFCAYATVQGRAYRPRPAADVADEMIWVEGTFQPRRILVRDLVFGASRTRAIAIARRLHAAGFHTPWECESRPEHFDGELLKEMAKAGCSVIKIGLETTDPNLLVKLDRVAAPQEAAHYLAYTRKMIADARRYGIITRVWVMVGLPGQTLAHVRHTADFLHEAAPTFVHPRRYERFPLVPAGDAQTPDQIDDLLPPLEVVAAERASVARRKPSRLQRVQRRIRLGR